MIPGLRNRWLWRSIICVTAVAVSAVSSGCISCAAKAVPAYRLSQEMLVKGRSGMVPIDFTLLRQQPPREHIIGPRDILGVYIQDVLPSTQARQEPSVLNVPVLTQQDYYPPRGMINSPAVGLPMEVSTEGKLILPLIPPLEVAGLTLPEATERIRRAYAVDRKILEPGRERILVSLIRARVNRVLVLRDDIAFGPVFQPEGGAALLTRRGTGNVLDLPVFENDVLHALATTGGLPGVDAFSTIWVFRAKPANPESLDIIKQRIDGGQPLGTFVESMKLEHSAVAIPLRVHPGAPLPFTPDDIVLNAGDVVYLETRQTEYFFSGGLLPAGQIPLPRDYDLDVLGALALATGSVGGPAGGVAASSFNFKGVYNPGNIIPPTRVLILRTLPNGEQVQIRVDLKKAQFDPRERITIAPGDMVMLYFKPGEVTGNVVMNFATFNVLGIIAASR